MLDSLDTLIAFTLIFTVVSQLITIIVQMITSWSNLRGGNLAWGIAEAFEAIAPGLARDWADPATNTTKSCWPRLNKLSFIFGSKLASNDTLAKRLADHCLSDRLISDCQFGDKVWAASAVRPDELFDLLHRIATGKKIVVAEEDLKKAQDDATATADEETTATERAENAKKSAEANEKDTSLATAAADAAKELETAKNASAAAKELLAKLSDADKIKDHVLQLFEGIGVSKDMIKDLQNKGQGTVDALKSLTDAVSSIDPKVKDALDADKAKLVAFLSDTDAQATKAIGATENAMRIAYQKFEQYFEMGQERSQEWFQAHAKIITLIFGFVFAFVLQLDTVEIFKLVSSNHDVKASLLAQLKPVTEQAQKVLADQSADSKKPDAQDAEKKHLDELATSYKAINADLNQTGFPLFPKDVLRWPSERFYGFFNHLLGILFSALLLSLGAPFWFNTLKSLASLRSSVAGNIADEKKAELKDGKAKTPGNPPTTVTK
jgi:hypothetical protein